MRGLASLIFGFVIAAISGYHATSVPELVAGGAFATIVAIAILVGGEK